MCGIAGMVDFQKVRSPEQNRKTAKAMIASLKRRGPDQDGAYFSEYVTFAHARLSVVDLENGRQPMRVETISGYKGKALDVPAIGLEDALTSAFAGASVPPCDEDMGTDCGVVRASIAGQDVVLVYNGELYNTEDIRQELLSRGYVFGGHSDTEVLLASYLEWGIGCPTHFNGIFAFSIWDSRNETLFFARDRMGVKPYFYAVTGSEYVFGSELKAILLHPGIKAQADLRTVSELILVGPGRTGGYGVFRGIEELMPGYRGIFSRAGLRVEPYWQLTDQEHRDSFEETAEHVRYLVSDSIRRQLVSDVPICVLMSGGLDSSAIASLAAKHLRERGQKLMTFSVDYVDNDKYFQTTKFQPNSDSYYIGIMRDYIDSDHTTVVIDPADLADALYAAVDARDLPGMADVDSSLLLFAREIKKKATVGLSGECADEIFGGYPWYRDPAIREREGFPWAQSTDFRAGLLREELASRVDAHDYVKKLYDDTVNSTLATYAQGSLERRMRQMTTLNMKWFMQTLLDRKDRMTMYNGLEVRVPFCDHRIAEYLYSTPWEYKEYEGKEKGLLRYAMTGVLPEAVLTRKKSPYPKTWHPAYMAIVSERLREIMASPSAPIWQIVRKDALERLLSEGRSSPWYGQLMTGPQIVAYMLQLNYWLIRYGVEIVD